MFNQCGYYRKPIPNSTIEVICINSMLYDNLSNHDGCNNCPCAQKQLDQLKVDLQYLKEKGKSAKHSKAQIA